MRNLSALLAVLVFLYGLNARAASAQTPGLCTAPDPFAQIGGGTCVNGGWIPPSNPTPPPPPPPPLPPKAIVVGEPMTGTITPDSAGELFFELTAPSDGTLVVHSLGDFANLWIDDVLFDYWPPLVGTLPVVAGRTYLVRVVVFFAYWDYPEPLPVSFVFTTSLIPPGGVVPVGCATRPPVPSNWVCFNGGWVPPELIDPAPPPTPKPQPAPPPTTGGCTTSDPFASLGGGTCVDGGWWPPGLLPPAPAAPPTPTLPGGCTTADPFVSIGGGVCVNGGWRPR
jgi:hypothetical protein